MFQIRCIIEINTLDKIPKNMGSGLVCSALYNSKTVTMALAFAKSKFH